MNISTFNRISRNSVLIFCLTIIVVVTASSVSYAQSGSSSSEVKRSVDWLKTQQQPNGGFEVAGFPGFETPDVISALASAAQTDSTYSTNAAYIAVTSVVSNSKTPLDYADDLADETITAGVASKLITNVVAPLGLDATDFDPSNDSPLERDLVETVNSAQLPNGSFGVGLFNTTLTCALALKLSGFPIADETVEYIVAAQASDGSFNYSGDITLLDGGADTTALAIEVLIASGKDRNDPAIQRALAYLANSINPDGSFSNFGTPDPNSTAAAVRGLNAAGINSSEKGWRDVYAPSRANLGYASPTTWLLSQQSVDGHVVSPYDSYGINTLATSQTVSTLAGSWFPIKRLDALVVAPTTTTVPVEVQGISVAQPNAESESVSGTLVNTGTDASDIAIVAVAILSLGACAAFFSRKKTI